jgi:hypothetical protein
MAFAIVSHVPQDTIEDFRATMAIVGEDPPDGCLTLVAGQSPTGLHVVAVWKSKAHADRFLTERLHPAFRQVGHIANSNTTNIEFDVDEFHRDAAVEAQ